MTRDHVRRLTHQLVWDDKRPDAEVMAAVYERTLVDVGRGYGEPAEIVCRFAVDHVKGELESRAVRDLITAPEKPNPAPLKTDFELKKRGRSSKGAPPVL